jgi:hypothetical protein
LSLRFGPLFRFVAGAEYTARALSRKLARKRQAEMLELPAHSERLRAGQAAADEKVDVVIADRPPRVLLIATIPWMFSARLACVLRKSGFHVEAICRVGHPLRQLSMPISIHQKDWIWEAASIEKAIEHANPDILISCDGYLHELHRRDPTGKLASLVEKSLGDSGAFETVERRSTLVSLAKSLGLRVPHSERTDSRQHLHRFRPSNSFSFVMKRDATWGARHENRYKPGGAQGRCADCPAHLGLSVELRVLARPDMQFLKPSTLV